MTTIHIGIVDDQVLFLHGIRRVIDSQADLQVVWLASNGAEALEQQAVHPVDIVLMDVQMPILDGITSTLEVADADVDTPLSDSDRIALDELTAREREVLVAIGRGWSNTEIAERMFISMPTVKTHVGRILSKTQSRDRVHAVLFAYRTGLVSRSDLLDE